MKTSDPKFLLPGALFGIMLLCGCSLLSTPDQSAIEYFDLARPEKTVSVPIDVEPFASFSGESRRMVRRTDEFSIRGSNFDKWLQSPGGMLTRYLRIAFRNEIGESILKNADPVIVRGEVLIFEVNKGFAELGVRYHLRYRKASWIKTVLIREKLDRRGPEAFARAMSRAANRFAQTIALEAGQIAAERK